MSSHEDDDGHATARKDGSLNCLSGAWPLTPTPSSPALEQEERSDVRILEGPRVFSRSSPMGNPGLAAQTR